MQKYNEYKVFFVTLRVLTSLHTGIKFIKMKKLLFLSVASLMAITMSSQDVIVTHDSKRIDAKVEEVSKEYIKYRKVSNPTGPLFVMNTTDIKLIVYENGEMQSFEQDTTSTATMVKQTIEEQQASLLEPAIVQQNQNSSKVKFVAYVEAAPMLGGEVTTVLTGSPEPLGIVLGGSCESYTAGAKIADFAFIGAGLGVNVAGGKSSYYNGKSLELFAVNIPLYADTRFWIPIPSQTFRPTVELALGVCFPLRAQVQMSDNYFANASNTSSKNSSLARITNGIDTVHVGPIPDSYRTTGDYAALFRIGIGGEFNRFVFGIGYELWGNNSDCDHFAFVKLGVRVGRL